MNEESRTPSADLSDDAGRQAIRPGSFLENVTAAVLIAVVLALGWVMVMAYQPESARLPSLEAEVVFTLVLLAAALILVSVVALLHTRR
jgi:hypothetical protein